MVIYLEHILSVLFVRLEVPDEHIGELEHVVLLRLDRQTRSGLDALKQQPFRVKSRSHGVDLVEIARVDGHPQMHRQLYIDFGRIVCDEVRRHILDLPPQFPEGLAVEVKPLAGVHGRRQLDLGGDVLQLQEGHPLAVVLDFLQLHNLEVVVDGVHIELEGAHVDDVGVAVLQVEDAGYLGRAKLLEVLEPAHILPVHDMDLVMLALLDAREVGLEMALLLCKLCYDIALCYFQLLPILFYVKPVDYPLFYLVLVFFAF